MTTFLALFDQLFSAIHNKEPKICIRYYPHHTNLMTKIKQTLTKEGYTYEDNQCTLIAQLKKKQ